MPRTLPIPGRKPKVVSKFFTQQQHQIDALFEKGFALHQQGQLDQAKTIYQEVLGRQATHFDSMHLLGVIAYQTQNLALAVELIGKALQINPKSAAAYYNRGMALKGVGRMEEALTCYEQAIALKPDYADAFNNRGIVLKELKRLDDALASYDKAIELKPDFAGAFLNRGIALKDLKKLEEALLSYDKAIALEPDFAEAFSNRLTLKAIMGLFPDALRDALKFKALPDFSDNVLAKGAESVVIHSLNSSSKCNTG